MNQLKLLFALLLATVAAAQAANPPAANPPAANPPATNPPAANPPAASPPATPNAPNKGADPEDEKSTFDRLVDAIKKPFNNSDEDADSKTTDGAKKNTTALHAKPDNNTATFNETETPGKIFVGSLSNQKHLILLYGLFGAAIVLGIVNCILTLSFKSGSKLHFDGLKAGASLGR